MSIKELAKKLSDPRITWHVSMAFGGWARKELVTSTFPQTLHICDEIICFPIRFSEYFMWRDGQGGITGRIFNLPEAWDHTNETNPTTSPPYDGTCFGVIGYSGYLVAVDLTDGTAKTRVRIVKRSYPELQVLIFNLGSITIRVNDPPATHGLSRYTTGTAGSGYVDLARHQYVVYYKSSLPGVDTGNYMFSTSPLGSGKRWAYEAYAVYACRELLGTKLYTGIKAPKDIALSLDIGLSFLGGSDARGGVNTSGSFRELCHGMVVHSNDPYCAQGTWDGGHPLIYATTGWAEDETGAVKFMISTTYREKHNTKWEKLTDRYTAIIYDSDLDESFALRLEAPHVDIISYGRGSAVIHPLTHEAVFTTFGAGIDAELSMCVQYDDTVLKFTSPAPSTWTYYDCYALMNCFSQPESTCLATAALGIYTDDVDAEVSIPSDARQAFGVGGRSDAVYREGLQVKPFMDRTLYGGCVYAVITRLKRFPIGATASEFKEWATKKRPYKISHEEWKGIINTPPFLAIFAAGAVPSGAVDFTVSGTPAPGQTITVSGTCPIPYAVVWLLLMDPDTYTVVERSFSSADAAGRFSASITIPSTAPAGKRYRLYTVCRVPPGG